MISVLTKAFILFFGEVGRWMDPGELMFFFGYCVVLYRRHGKAAILKNSCENAVFDVINIPDSISCDIVPSCDPSK